MIISIVAFYLKFIYIYIYIYMTTSLDTINPFEIKAIYNWVINDFPDTNDGGDDCRIMIHNIKNIIFTDSIITQICQEYTINNELDRMKHMFDRYLNIIENKSKYNEDIQIFLNAQTYDLELDAIYNIAKKIKIHDFDELLYPVGVKCKEEGGHAIGTYYKKISENEYYFYIINTGDGSSYQNVEDNLLKNHGIMCFKVSLNDILYIYGMLFIYNVHLPTIYFFYNVILKILFVSHDKLLEPVDDDTSKKMLIDSPKYCKSIICKLQVTGNCTVVSVINVFEILMTESNNTGIFHISEQFNNIYDKIKIVLLHKMLKYFCSNMLIDANYPLFLKLNQIYLYLLQSHKEYNIEMNEQNIKIIYDFYIKQIENCTNIDEIKCIPVAKLMPNKCEHIDENCNTKYDDNVKKFNSIINNCDNPIILEPETEINTYYEETCININECKYIQECVKSKINLTDYLSYLKEELSMSNEQLLELNDKLNKLSNDMNSLIGLLSKLENIELCLKYLNDYMDILNTISSNTEDIINVRMRQYYTIEIIQNIYKNVKSNILDKNGVYDMNQISKYILNISSITYNLNINWFVYNKLSKFYNSEVTPYRNYKITIYDTIIMYCIMICSMMYEYVNVKIPNVDPDNHNLLQSYFNCMALCDKHEYDMATYIINEIKENIRYFVKSTNIFNTDRYASDAFSDDKLLQSNSYVERKSFYHDFTNIYIS